MSRGPGLAQRQADVCMPTALSHRQGRDEAQPREQPVRDGIRCRLRESCAASTTDNLAAGPCKVEEPERIGLTEACLVRAAGNHCAGRRVEGSEQWVGHHYERE